MQNHKLLHNSSIIMSRTIIDKLSSNLILTLTSKSLQYAILWEKPQACREGGGGGGVLEPALGSLLTV